jgi:xanthine/CO dehydrogenase XdhC/CoxF family maturation factor
MNSPWPSLLSGPLRTQSLEAVEAVIQDVASLIPGRWPASLMEGHLGLALFFDMASRLTGGRYDEQVAHCLEQATERLARGEPPAGLHVGLGGLGWTVLHLAERHSLDIEELCAQVDEELEARLQKTPTPYGCDLREGLAGIGLYALKRLPHPSGQRLLERVVELLEATAEVSGPDLTWPLPRSYWALHGPGASFPNGLYTVGVAHGIPPALAVLAAAHRLGIARAKAELLLDRGFAWLGRLASPTGHPAFPHFLHGAERVTDERFSWCVGNPGITAVLWWAAHLWGHPMWTARALDWARHVAREALERPLPAVTNLCCGSAGTAHLFLRLFQATREPLFEEAAVRWLRHTLSLRQPGSGIGGFDFKQSAQPVPVLQYGASGTALTLLAAASDLAPDWDEAFLFSLHSPLRSTTPTA